MAEFSGAYRLRGYVQHYAWGGFDFIPGLLHLKNPSREPYAELWMGTHPRGPARLIEPPGHPELGRCISRDPVKWLGAITAEKFHNDLPFLFKVLDVRKMLSIQAHPSRAEARRGFERENGAGIPLDAPNRVFRDRNHKPEIMVALSDFYLLHGFRDPGSIGRELNRLAPLRPLLPPFRNGSIKALYEHIMSMPQEKVNRMLQPLYAQLEAEDGSEAFSRDRPEHWALRAFRDYTTEEGNFDRGIYSLFLLNLVKLKPGEGIFQRAGLPHAYLAGINVELMANSDNVFRGGLTAKHIDVPALMQHLDFSPVKPEILYGAATGEHERSYPAPIPDFELTGIDLPGGKDIHLGPYPSLQLFIVIQGSGQWMNEEKNFERGTIFALLPGHTLSWHAGEDIQAYRAGTPVPDQSK